MKHRIVGDQQYEPLMQLGTSQASQISVRTDSDANFVPGLIRNFPPAASVQIRLDADFEVSAVTASMERSIGVLASPGPGVLERTVPQQSFYIIVGAVIQGLCYFSDHRFTFIPRCGHAGERAAGARKCGGVKGKSGSWRCFHDKRPGQGGSVAALGLLDNDACFGTLDGREEWSRHAITGRLLWRPGSGRGWGACSCQRSEYEDRSGRRNHERRSFAH